MPLRFVSMRRHGRFMVGSHSSYRAPRITTAAPAFADARHLASQMAKPVSRLSLYEGWLSLPLSLARIVAFDR